MKMQKYHKIIAICGILGAFMIHIVVGAIHRWIMIAQYVNIQYNYQEDMPIAPLSMLCAGITMRLGYQLSIQFGTGIILMIGIIITTLTSIVSSIIISY